MELVGGDKVKINLGCITRDEGRALKRKLVIELEKVRGLVKQLEKEETFFEGEVRVRHSHDPGLVNKKSKVVGSLKRVNSEVGSVGPLNSRASSEATRDNVGEFRKKVKKSAKGNQDSGSVPKKAKSGKFPSSVDNNGMVKSSGDCTMGFASSSQLFKSCSALLVKLMKHKFSWVFNEPVDAKKLGLRDYFTIVEHPMDLGTVKSRLSKNWYKSAKEFAEDVRLTFYNAMLYNPKGQDARYMADQLSKMFEEMWKKEIEDKFNLNKSAEVGYDVNLSTPTSRVSGNPVSVPTPAPRPAPRPASETRTMERTESVTVPVDSLLKSGGTNKTPVPKKPKEKDLDKKREMSYDEKQRISTSVQTLPSDKLDNVVQIIKKRNPGLFQEEDDIEVDLDSLDPETLWELDRFVTNYQKSLSMNKRKAEVTLPDMAEGDHNTNEENITPPTVERPTVTEAAEKANAPYSPVRVEQPGDINGSRSSNSGSSSSGSGSSSSDSDSGSSSGSGSDAGH